MTRSDSRAPEGDIVRVQTQKRKWLSSRTVGPLSMGLALVAVGACGSDDGDPPPDENPPTGPGATAPPGHSGTVLAFSGGGYHALSGGAAWLMGMMERRQDFELANITANVESIGSNSGGSWFMTLASYSPTFLAELETPGEYRRFAAPENVPHPSHVGYMVKVWDYISRLSGGCLHVPLSAIAACNAIYPLVSKAVGAGFANFLFSGSGQWETVVENSVFGKAPKWKYYAELANQKLGSPRNSWTRDKTLVMAGTLLTDAPSLTYYLYSGGPVVGFVGVQASQAQQEFFEGGDHVPGGVPLMLGALRQEGGSVPVDLLPGGATTMTYGEWNEKFQSSSSTAQLDNAAYESVVPTLPVIHAAAISSAAGGGFIDIQVMKDNANVIALNARNAATALNGFAPGFQMVLNEKNAPPQPVMTFHDEVHAKFSSATPSGLTANMAKNSIIRAADGGLIDNTAVAQMLRHLQDAGGGTIQSGFNIVAFDDFPGVRPDSNGIPLPTGPDVASLFGLNGCAKAKKTDPVEVCHLQTDGLSRVSFVGLEYTGISMQVFPTEQYFKTQDGEIMVPLQPLDAIYWQPEFGKNEEIVCSVGGVGEVQPLIYSRYAVTVDDTLPGSRALGISATSAGATGTLHVFAILGATAAVVPGTQDEFDCFDTMIRGIVDNVTPRGGAACDTSMPRSDTNLCTLGDYLEDALGL